MLVIMNNSQSSPHTGTNCALPPNMLRPSYLPPALALCYSFNASDTVTRPKPLVIQRVSFVSVLRIAVGKRRTSRCRLFMR